MNAREVEREVMENLVAMLRTAVVGDWVQNDDDRMVEVVDMVGGRYLLWDEHGYVDGPTFSVEQAVKYLMEA